MGAIWAHIYSICRPYGPMWGPYGAHMGSYGTHMGPTWTHMQTGTPTRENRRKLVFSVWWPPFQSIISRKTKNHQGETEKKHQKKQRRINWFSVWWNSRKPGRTAGNQPATIFVVLRFFPEGSKGTHQGEQPETRRKNRRKRKNLPNFAALQKSVHLTEWVER